jgi:diguanylate cyclase (GGDEF)-like protein
MSNAVPRQLQLVMVEDSEADAALVLRSLRKAGQEVNARRVQTEQEFIAALKTKKPDLILSDFHLPEFSGLRALEVAVVHAPEIPFIYVSGTIGEERAIEALRRGATDYVLKSNLSRLPSAVERALRESAMKLAQRVSEQQRREQGMRLQRLTRTYRMLSSTSSAILRLRDRIELLDEICRIAVHQGGYDHVAISLMDTGTNAPRRRAWAGGDAETFRKIRAGELDSKVLPLLIDSTEIGAITLYSAQRGIFDQAEVGVLQELTANLSFALQYLDKDEAVQFLSYFDSLTGLAKRPLFCQRLAKSLASDSRTDGARMVVVFDVQKLGAVNDSLGRYVGDALIERIAARVKQTFADPDCMAYFGGGTFAVVLETVEDREDTGRLLQNAAAQCFVEPFTIDGQELRPAVRSGIAFYPHDAATADALVQNAEAALKAAREDSEKYMLYGYVTKRPTSRSFALEARLAGALERDEFVLHYQPKVAIDSGALTGFEALLRWQDSEEGLVPPGIFVPLLERSGAIVDVGEWVLRQAARDLRGWVAAGFSNLRIAVNVSPLQLRRRDFVNRVLASIEPVIRRPAGLDIEITESMLMHDLELSIVKLEELRAAGIGVAIDDFGTGYSSLRLLDRLPVDTLKVDRSFIQSIADAPNVKTLVSTVVALARAFNMKTVAEGVETWEQLKMLRSIQCDQAQGYLFGRPTAAAEVPGVIGKLAKAGS